MYIQIKNWSKKHGSNSLRRSVLTQFVNDQVTDAATLPRNEIMEKWDQSDPATKANYRTLNGKRPDPITSLYQQDHHFGVISETLENLINLHCKENAIKDKEKDKFQSMIYKKSMMSLVAPGEPVGEFFIKSIKFIINVKVSWVLLNATVHALLWLCKAFPLWKVIESIYTSYSTPVMSSHSAILIS